MMPIMIEAAFRSALVTWLRGDAMLAGMVNAIEEEGPVAASPPSVAIVASAAADRSHKTGAGREIRLALEVTHRTDDPGSIAAIAAQVEQRIATLAPDQTGLRVAATQFLRSRVERRARSSRAVLLEYRFLVFATE